jgi:hypothetical protein
MNQELEKMAEVRGKGGEVLYTIWLNPNNAELRRRADDPKESGDQKKEETQDQGAGGNGDLMTDSQKRYLFRLLAKEGIEGEAAYAHLKKEFRVESLKDVTKSEASRAIDQMVNG